jgi:hypothetical protein
MSKNITLAKSSAGRIHLTAQLENATKHLAAQKVEIASLRREIASVHAQAVELKTSPNWKRMLAAKDSRIFALAGEVQTALRAAGLRASSVVLEIDPAGGGQDPREAYAAAVESGDKAGAAEIFKARKSELFRK